MNYLELTVNPIRHTTKGLKPREVLNFINEEIASLTDINKNICDQIIIGLNMKKVTPIYMQQMSKTD